MRKGKLVLNVNGVKYELTPRATATLADVLREELGLTGTKIMCNQGECGSCTVLINGKPTLSCIMLAMDAEGKEITTIEGLQDPVTGELHPIQKEFVKNTAVQCGVCTPGMIVTAKALLDANPNPSEAEIREALSGNICRCGTYRKITDAVLEAAAIMKTEKDVAGFSSDNDKPKNHLRVVNTGMPHEKALKGWN